MKHLLFFSLIFSIPASLSSANVVTEAQTQESAPAPLLPEGEQRIRTGIMMMADLYKCMASVRDKDSAEAAVPQIMRLCESFSKWPQSFTNLPPLSEPEIQAYEDRYLPTINRINKMIEEQADRLSAAEYYGSLNLPAALVRLLQIHQS